MIKKLRTLTLTLATTGICIPVVVSCNQKEEDIKPVQKKAVEWEPTFEMHEQAFKATQKYLNNLKITNYGTQIIDYFINKKALPVNFNLKTTLDNLYKQYKKYEYNGRVGAPFYNGAYDHMFLIPHGRQDKDHYTSWGADFYWSAFNKYIKMYLNDSDKKVQADSQMLKANTTWPNSWDDRSKIKYRYMFGGIAYWYATAEDKITFDQKVIKAFGLPRGKYIGYMGNMGFGGILQTLSDIL